MRARLSVLSFMAVAFLAGSAGAHPTYGVYVDKTCTANGWIPAKPFNPTGLMGNCGLCHTNAQSPTRSLTPAGTQFKASGHTDVTPFCSPPATNQPPHFDPVAARTATVGALYTLTVRAGDPEGDLILLTVSNAPAGATFVDAGNGTGTFYWTPAPGDVGSHTVTFHAADTGTPMGVAALDVPIAVGQGVNNPPVLAPVGNRNADVGVDLVVALSATDADGDALTFAAIGMPAGASLVGNEFHFTPDASQVGVHPVTFSVTDAGNPPAMDSERIAITVGATNHPPVLAPIGNRSAVVGTATQIALSATDPDGDALALACAGLPGDAAFNDFGNGTGVIDWSPASAATSLVSCTATDGGSPPLADAEAFTLTATPETPVPDGASPVIDDARWIARDATLLVRGHWDGGSGAVQPIAVYGMASDGGSYLLGNTRSRGGAFATEIKPFIAPCEVAAGTDGNPGAVAVVTGAPRDCGQTLLTRARAEIECEHGVLHLEGRRGPIGGAIVLVDGTTGADLAQVPVRGRGGEFSFEGIVGSAPRRLQLRAELGAASWQLAEPIPVRRGGCQGGEREAEHSRDSGSRTSGSREGD